MNAPVHYDAALEEAKLNAQTLPLSKSTSAIRNSIRTTFIIRISSGCAGRTRCTTAATACMARSGR